MKPFLLLAHLVLSDWTRKLFFITKKALPYKDYRKQVLQLKNFSESYFTYPRWRGLIFREIFNYFLTRLTFAMHTFEIQ